MGPRCCETLRDNQTFDHPVVRDWPLIEGDVRRVDFAAFEEKLDLVSGGPPCQPFSLGGKHKAHDDARDMFPQAIRAVRQARPRAFVFENVKGLTRAAFRNYFEYIKLQLEHPELVARAEEDWADHLAQLERHHTHGAREGLHYRVVAQGAERRRPWRAAAARAGGLRRLPRRSRSGMELSASRPIRPRRCCGTSISSGEYWERHRRPRARRGQTIRRGESRGELEERPATCAWLTVRDAIADLPDPERERRRAAKSPTTASSPAREPIPATPAARWTSRPRR